MLPGIDGYAVISRIREISMVPIIMLTARTDIDDELHALDLGADGFLTKPLRPSVLIAHLKVWLKRYESIKEITHGKINQIITVGHFEIDRKKHLVTITNAKGKRDVLLTPTQFALLILFASQPRTAFSREKLLKKVWNWDDAEGTRTVDAHIGSLRRKIGAEYVITLHGLGYSFLPTGEADVQE
jgi:DNA-binding response OmpR family regulator